MREGEAPGTESKYAEVALIPCTSRNWSVSAPRTCPAFHVVPPSVVTTKVPNLPLAQATRAFTGLMPISPEAVWLFCGVIVGVRVASSSALVANSGADGDWFEQLRRAATAAAARACDRRIMTASGKGAKKRRDCTNVNLRPSSWRSFARALP